MLARYIGKDGSMGFSKGRIYSVWTDIESQRLRKDGYLWIKVKHSNLKCPYSNLENLLKNWEIISLK